MNNPAIRSQPKPTLTTPVTVSIPESNAAAPSSSSSASASGPSQAEPTLYKSFDDMGLRESILRGIYAFGFEKPSLIQQQGIVPMSSGRDMIMQAQAGTGKTGAFTIGLLQRMDFESRSLQVLVLSPTRDLALQTNTVVAALGDHADVSTYCAIGGQSLRDDMASLGRSGVQVLNGTPGRVYDLILQGVIRPETVHTVVLDEVDVMLSTGFKDQVRDIFVTLSRDVQAVLVSATLSPEVLAIADSFLRDPVKILVPVEDIPLSSIKQFYIDCERSEHKTGVLCDLYEELAISKSIIFCNRREGANRLAEELQRQDFSVTVIHSDMSQQERNMKMKEFRSGLTRVLIATNLLARGIDVQQVSIVVNFDLPHDHADYIHRVGRGGRLGREAIAINLLGGVRDVRTLQDIESFYSIRVPEMPNNIRSLLS